MTAVDTAGRVAVPGAAAAGAARETAIVGRNLTKAYGLSARQAARASRSRTLPGPWPTRASSPRTT